jgi:hypothetical protein
VWSQEQRHLAAVAMSVKPGFCRATLFTLATGVLLRLRLKRLALQPMAPLLHTEWAVRHTSGGNMKRGNGDKQAKRETRSNDPKQEGLENLLYQVLETELGGVQVYKTAIQCAVNEELRGEWEKYLTETERHVEIARGMLEQLELDPEVETPGRAVVRHIGESLVTAMEKARESGKPEEAEVVAAECVVLAETKDHSNWELIGLMAEKSKGDLRKLLREAYDEVEKDEDHHLYHTKGWARELSIQALGLPAVLPPPEEEKNVETAIGAARAQNARGEML